MRLRTGKSAEATALPAIHSIEPGSGMGTTDDDLGADAFANLLDHPDSRYYHVNDFYNMESIASLHIIPHLETYQQTTEFSCGAASALIVLNHYGVHDYNEIEISRLAYADPSKGISVENLAAFFEGIGWETEYHADTEPFLKISKRLRNI